MVGLETNECVFSKRSLRQILKKFDGQAEKKTSERDDEFLVKLSPEGRKFHLELEVESYFTRIRRIHLTRQKDLATRDRVLPFAFCKN